jgi:hypothetical protein
LGMDPIQAESAAGAMQLNHTRRSEFPGCHIGRNRPCGLIMGKQFLDGRIYFVSSDFFGLPDQLGNSSAAGAAEPTPFIRCAAGAGGHQPVEPTTIPYPAGDSSHMTQ